MNKKSIQIAASTLFALFAFAGNSVLCRMALGGDKIDAASFTNIRLLSGILVLMIAINLTQKSGQPDSKGSWLAACMLFIYAAAFSYGYISLDTGTGALVLFGTVQITMIMTGCILGNRLHYSEWLGLFIAFSGFIYLVLPSLSTPSLVGFVLMTISGIGWGFYTLAGRASKNPLGDTAYNFLRTIPLILILMAFTYRDASISSEGVLLAVLSGAVASGIGYFVWYIALAELSVTRASVVQLFVPVIAAFGGVIFTNEQVTMRLVASSVLVLGGTLLVILGRNYFTESTSAKM